MMPGVERSFEVDVVPCLGVTRRYNPTTHHCTAVLSPHTNLETTVIIVATCTGMQHANDPPATHARTSMYKHAQASTCWQSVTEQIFTHCQPKQQATSNKQLLVSVADGKSQQISIYLRCNTAAIVPVVRNSLVVAVILCPMKP